jgi:hypothetical protein
MESFLLVERHVDSPRVIHSGADVPRLTFEACGSTGEYLLSVDLDSLAARGWRHYYTDAELQALQVLFCWGLRFILGSETAVAVPFGRPVYLQPLYKYRSEWTVCFCYDEVSPLHFVYWLIGVARRNLDRAEYNRRMEELGQYWDAALK